MATSADRADEADPREDVHAPPATSNGSTSSWRFRTLKHVTRTFRSVPVSAPCPKHCEADRPRRCPAWVSCRGAALAEALGGGTIFGRKTSAVTLTRGAFLRSFSRVR